MSAWQREARLARLARAALSRLQNARLAAAWTAWQHHFALRKLGQQTVAKLRNARLAAAWGSWQGFTAERASLRRRLQGFRQTAHAQTKAEILLLWRRWAGPCAAARRLQKQISRGMLSGILEGWRQRAVKGASGRRRVAAAVAQMAPARASRVLSSWRAAASSQGRSTALCRVISAILLRHLKLPSFDHNMTPLFFTYRWSEPTGDDGWIQFGCWCVSAPAYLCRWWHMHKKSSLWRCIAGCCCQAGKQAAGGCLGLLDGEGRGERTASIPPVGVPVQNRAFTAACSLAGLEGFYLHQGSAPPCAAGGRSQDHAPGIYLTLSPAPELLMQYAMVQCSYFTAA